MALTSERPYRPPSTLTRALTELWNGTGKTYDSSVVGALFALVREGRIRSSHEPAAALQLA